MKRLLSKLKTVCMVWKATAKIMLKYPIVAGPFLITGIAYAAIIPAVSLFGYLTGYSFNYLILPRLLDYGINVTGLMVGVYCSSAAAFMAYQASNNVKPMIYLGFRRAARKYIPLVLTGAGVLAITIIMLRLISLLVPPSWPWWFVLILSYSVMIVMQLFYVFLIPAVIIEQKKLAASIKRSIMFVCHNLLESVILAGAPCLLFAVPAYINAYIPTVAQGEYPQQVFLLLAVRIMFLILIDILTILSAAYLFSYYRKRVKEG